MANYLLKSDSLGIEPAEFEDLSNESANVLRAYKHGRKSNEEITQHPLAKNFIRQNATTEHHESVEVCMSPLFETEETKQAIEPEEEEQEKSIDPDELVQIKQQWDEIWQSKLEDAVEKTRTEAYGRGYADAKAALTQEVSTEKETFTDALKTLQKTHAAS